jgi:hypothetical protein
MNDNGFLYAIAIITASLTPFLIYDAMYSDAQEQINVTELETLDRMRYTAIQMTVLDLEGQQPTNMSNDEIVNEIYEFQQSNGSNDRLTTIEIEELYRNLTSAR